MKKLIIILFLFIFLKVNSQTTFETIYETPNSQITLYIVSQGYTNASMGNFNTFVNGFLNELWNTEPYNEFQQNFRVVLVRVIAAQEGNPGAFNQFNPAYSCGGGSTNFAETYANFNSRMDNLRSTLPFGYNDNSYLMAIFNSDYYTGGGGKYTFVSSYCQDPLMYKVAVHEFSHTFALLGDEYGFQQETPTVGPNDFPLFHNRNVTQQTTRSAVPWNYLIANTTTLPTCTFNSSCSSTVTGLYESANYADTGWYRPQNTCMMKDLDFPFCLTCKDIIRETVRKHLCIPNNIINESFDSRHHTVLHWRKASSSLTSNSVVGNQVNLNYLSGTTTATGNNGVITLTNGFHAKAGSVFRGYIGDCSYIDIRNTYRVAPKEKVLPSRLIRNKSSRLNQKATTDKSITSDLSISPNPTNDFITIQSDNIEINNITIVSFDGKAIYNQNVSSNQEQLDLSNYASGIYLLNIQTQDGEMHTRKLIKK